MNLLDSFKQTWNQMPVWLRDLFMVALVVAGFFAILLVATDPIFLVIIVLVLLFVGYQWIKMHGGF